MKRKSLVMTDDRDFERSKLNPVKPEHSIFDRKQKRKEARKSKKLQKKEYYDRFHDRKRRNSFEQRSRANSIDQSTNVEPTRKKSFDSQPTNLPKSQKKQPPQVKPQRLEPKSIVKESGPIQQENVRQRDLQEEIKRDEEEIERLEKKLGFDRGVKYKKKVISDNTNDNWDPDLFGFLDNITKRVRKNEEYDWEQFYNKNDLEGDLEAEDEDMDGEGDIENEEDQDEMDIESGDMMEEEEMEGESGDIMDEEEEEGEEMGSAEMDIEDEGSEVEEGEQDEGIEDGYGEGIEEEDVDDSELEVEEEEPTKPDSHTLKGPANKTQPKKEEATKSLGNSEHIQDLTKAIRGHINRLSEGNIEPIFNKIIELYRENPRPTVNQIYWEIFCKACIDQPNVLQMILASNTAMLAGLHQVFDNEFLAVFMKGLALKFKENESTGAGLKNIVLVFCFLFHFDCVAPEFIYELAIYLGGKISETSLELLHVVIQTTAIKLRKDNPTLIKDLFNILKNEIVPKAQLGKTNDSNGENVVSKKLEFIVMDLNDIKLNKLAKYDIGEKIMFLVNFVKKTVIGKLHVSEKMFPVNFNHVINNTFDNNQWFNTSLRGQTNDKEKDYISFDTMTLSMTNEFRQKLEKMAQTQRFTTEIRKKIFFAVMGASDFIDAAQLLMKLKLSKKQNKEIGVVITACCAQEQTFNEYYAFLACKLIEINEDVKYAFQYALWDHFKLMDSYKLRKIANLSKFQMFLVKKGVLPIQSLKGLNFDELNEHQSLFLKLFFKKLFEGCSAEEIFKLFKQIPSANNEQLEAFKVGLKNFLEIVYAPLVKKQKSEDDEEGKAKFEEEKRKVKVAIGRL